MAFRDDLEALSTTDIAITGDGWGPKVSALMAKLLPALQEMARAVESNKTEIDNNEISAASSDLSNVSESDIVRRVLNNPASIANGTLLQVRDGLIEPLAQDTLSVTLALESDKPDLLAVSGIKTFAYQIGTFPIGTPTTTTYSDAAYGSAIAAFYADGARADEERVLVAINRQARTDGGNTITTLNLRYRVITGTTT